MDDIATLERTTSDSKTPLKLDAVVIGAGVAGLYQLHLLRSQGLAVKAFEAGSDVGGTWYWNRYPGARLDSESPSYQYLFSQELYEGWDWSERFSAQPEIERWLQYVADRLDLRKDIEFNTTIKSAHFDGQGPSDRCAFPGHLLRHAVGAAHVPFPGTGDVQGAVVPHRALAEGPGRFRRQARRRGRHRRDGDPGRSNHCGQGRSPDSIRPHSAVRNTDEEPEIHASRSGGIQIGVQPDRSASAAHIQRLCLRLREPVGRADARAAPRRAAGDLPGRFAQVLDRVLRGTLPRSRGERTGLGVRS